MTAAREAADAAAEAVDDPSRLKFVLSTVTEALAAAERSPSPGKPLTRSMTLTGVQRRCVGSPRL